MKKKRLILLILSSFFLQSQTLLAEEWSDVPGIAMQQQGFKVRINSGVINLFSTSPKVPYTNLRLTGNVGENENLSLRYWGTQGSPDTTATVDLGVYSLTLKGTSSIDSSRDYPARHLIVTGSDKSALNLYGSAFGMKLRGDFQAEVSSIDSINIFQLSGSKSPAAAGISALALSNVKDKENVKLNISGLNLFQIQGNINHGIASYGNNNLNVASNQIVIQLSPVGRYTATATDSSEKPYTYSPVLFNALILGSGKINLSSQESGVTLSGFSDQNGDVYKESYAIRGSEEVCDQCSPGATRYFDADFSITSASYIDLNTNWGAVFMEALKDEQDGTTYHAKTTLKADEIRIKASGTSENGETNATFKAVSDLDKEASISLIATGKNGININYIDTLNKEKQEDIFYAQGKSAQISLDAPYIEINNKFNDVDGNHADVRNIFFADNKASITLTGRTKIFGNTSARDGGKVALNLSEGSEITGGMFDNSFPYHEAALGKPSTHPDKGNISLVGSSSSVWHVLPYVDSQDRGTIFKKETYNSMVFSIAGGNATKNNPFVVNLTGPEKSQSSTLPYQKLHVTNLAGTGVVQFNLRFDDKNGTSSGVQNGRDALVVHNGEGNHTLYVQYLGDQSSEEPESLRNSWLVLDNSQQADFKLANEGGTVDIGIYKYSLAVEKDTSEIGGGIQGNYWYLKRGVSPDTNPDNPTPPAPGGDDGPFTPAADTELSFAGSQRYLHWSDLQDLRKRLGEVRYGCQDGAWARGIFQKDLTDGTEGASGLKQTYYGVNFGFDHLINVSERQMSLLGLSFNVGRAKQRTRSNNNGRGDTDRYGINGYATWALNSGEYADFVLSADYFRQDISTKANDIKQTGKYNTFGLGASIEVGKQFSFESRDLSWGPWYRHTWIEPQLQLSYYWLSGKKYKLSNKGLKVNIKDDDSLIGRAGLVIGTKWNYGENYGSIDKRFVQAYIKGGVKHDFLGNYKVSLNDQIFSKDIGKTTGYYGVGLDWQAAGSTRFYMQLEREHGSHYTKEYEVSVGMKYQF